MSKKDVTDSQSSKKKSTATGIAKKKPQEKKKDTSAGNAKQKPEKKKDSTSLAAVKAKQKPEKKLEKKKVAPSTAVVSAKKKPETKPSTGSAAGSKSKALEKKKSAGLAAGNKKKPMEKKRSSGLAAGNKRKPTLKKKKSTGVSEIVKDKVIRGPAYQLTVWRANTGLKWSVTVAKLREKMTCTGASLKLVVYSVTHGVWHPMRRMAAVQATEYKKTAAAEKTVQLVHAAQGRAAARRAKAAQNRAAHLSQAVY